jgi:glycosyltransferase involved in cell wall biosynthesis
MRRAVASLLIATLLLPPVAEAAPGVVARRLLGSPAAAVQFSEQAFAAIAVWSRTTQLASTVAHRVRRWAGRFRDGAPRKSRQSEGLTIVALSTIDLRYIGGLEGRIHSTHEALMAIGPINIQVLYGTRDDVLPYIVEKNGSRLSEIPVRRWGVMRLLNHLILSISFYHRAARIVKDERAANRRVVLHLYTPFNPASILATAVLRWRFGLPAVVTSHSTRPLYLHNQLFTAILCFFVPLGTIGMEVTGVSRASTRYFINPPRMLVSSVDVDFFDERLADPRAFRQRYAAYGLSPTAALLVDPSRIEPFKGQDRLISLAEHLRTMNYDAQIVLMGPIQNEAFAAELLRTIREKDLSRYFCVLPEGQPTDVRDALAAATLVVHPTRTEALSNMLLQAAAMRRAVVTYAVGGIPEQMIHGETGYMASPGDTLGFNTYVMRLLERPQDRGRMGQSARQFVVRNFHRKRVAGRLMDLYRSLAGLLVSPTDASTPALSSQAIVHFSDEIPEPLHLAVRRFLSQRFPGRTFYIGVAATPYFDDRSLGLFMITPAAIAGGEAFVIGQMKAQLPDEWLSRSADPVRSDPLEGRFSSPARYRNVRGLEKPEGSLDPDAPWGDLALQWLAKATVPLGAKRRNAALASRFFSQHERLLPEHLKWLEENRVNFAQQAERLSVEPGFPPTERPKLVAAFRQLADYFSDVQVLERNLKSGHDRTFMVTNLQTKLDTIGNILRRLELEFTSVIEAARAAPAVPEAAPMDPRKVALLEIDPRIPMPAQRVVTSILTLLPDLEHLKVGIDTRTKFFTIPGGTTVLLLPGKWLDHPDQLRQEVQNYLRRQNQPPKSHTMDFLGLHTLWEISSSAIASLMSMLIVPAVLAVWQSQYLLNARSRQQLIIVPETLNTDEQDNIIDVFQLLPGDQHYSTLLELASRSRAHFYFTARSAVLSLMRKDGDVRRFAKKLVYRLARIGPQVAAIDRQDISLTSTQLVADLLMSWLADFAGNRGQAAVIEYRRLYGLAPMFDQQARLERAQDVLMNLVNGASLQQLEELWEWRWRWARRFDAISENFQFLESFTERLRERFQEQRTQAAMNVDQVSLMAALRQTQSRASILAIDTVVIVSGAMLIAFASWIISRFRTPTPPASWLGFNDISPITYSIVGTYRSSVRNEMREWVLRMLEDIQSRRLARGEGIVLIDIRTAIDDFISGSEKLKRAVRVVADRDDRQHVVAALIAMEIALRKGEAQLMRGLYRSFDGKAFRQDDLEVKVFPRPDLGQLIARAQQELEMFNADRPRLGLVQGFKPTGKPNGFLFIELATMTGWTAGILAALPTFQGLLIATTGLLAGTYLLKRLWAPPARDREFKAAA